ncbi:septum site-determining protein MinC [Ramlibacter humi]|uniref:Probable septum site-determining protein MinC n=1 Tax=Ramlibacter humi TaxID=2530451 RepID=A0A4Z0BFL0_9BURK|nr:septum site-determining protein MinC [Ramlibacter humi]TFY97169.1 septum site-determining protein MinC [Ramlibacter humi]
MSVAPAGVAPATFELKSANLPLVSLLLKSADLQALAEELKTRFGDIPDFFDHDPLVVDLTPLPPDAQVDFPALQRLLRQHRVVPVAVRGGSETLAAAARDSGLAQATEAVPLAVRPRDEPAPAPVAAPAPAGALIVDKPLRSGQQVYARGRDLVVMSIVNAGAEVIADGSIHVYAPLRGKAIAGARGDAAARIVSLALEPELVSIAGVYRTSDVPLPPEVLGKPTQVRLAGGAEGKLVMAPLNTA